jgi:transposase
MEVIFILSKYPDELKQEVINKYLEGKGSPKSLGHEFRIPWHTIQNWVDNQRNGKPGLTKHFKTQYDYQFKLMVVNDYLSGGKSYSELSAKYSIYPRTSINNWVTSYKKFGDNGLMSKPKGRPTNKPTKVTTSVNKTNDQLSEKELRDKVERLEIENAYLKALRALAISPNSQIEPKSKQ